MPLDGDAKRSLNPTRATSPTSSSINMSPETTDKDSPNSGIDSLHDKEYDLSTPQTEASSPASQVDDADFNELVVEGGALAASQQSQALCSKQEERESGKGEEEDELVPPMMMMSQTDQHIRQLDQVGELNEVAGSQSLLSQELLYQVSSQQDEGGEDEGDSEDGDAGGARSEGGGLEVGDFHLSQQTETSIGMAVRLGLLSQTQDYDEDDLDEMSPQDNLNLVSAQAENATKSHISGLDLLTRAGRNDATSLVSFSQDAPTGATTTMPDLSDTPIRESEGFGSLLDAVAKITEQEDIVDTLTPAWEGAVSSLDYASISQSRDQPRLGQFSSSSSSRQRPKIEPATSSGDSSTRKRQLRKNVAATQKLKHKLPETNAALSTTTSSAHRSKTFPSNKSSSRTLKSGGSYNVSKISANHGASGNNKASVSTTGSPSKKRKSMTMALPDAMSQLTDAQKTIEASRLKSEQKDRDLEILRAQAEAKRAAELAERTISDPVIAKRLLLSMALVRENPRSVPDVLPGPGHILQEGFFWAHYPPLELVLKKHMMEYYELSTTKCQSAQQQAFNNDMVVVVQEVCEKQGWKFADCFDSKGLRDRIRCYYKTHIQNAKKRLRTMVRNPTKRANARHLCEHLDLIEKHKAASASSAASESAEPRKKKQHLDSDRQIAQKSQKAPPKTCYNVAATSASSSSPCATDNEGRDRSSCAAGTEARDDQLNPKVTSDPMVTPITKSNQGANNGMTTPDSSTYSTDLQSSSVASGTRRAKRMVSSTLSPLVI